MEELKETLNNQKTGKLSGEGNLNSEHYKYAGNTFLEILLFLITFILWEKCRKSIKTV